MTTAGDKAYCTNWQNVYNLQNCFNGYKQRERDYLKEKLCKTGIKQERNTWTTTLLFLYTTSPKTNNALVSLVASCLFYLTFDGSQLLYFSTIQKNHYFVELTTLGYFIFPILSLF